MTQISQDELTNKIIKGFFSSNQIGKTHIDQHFALRKVVLLHKEKIDMNGYGACEECSRTAYYNVPWPCKTIKEISDELFIN